MPPASSLPPANPAPSASGTEHVVKSGDTIGALATKYHVTAKAILEANPNVNPKNLKVESKLTIPAPAPAAAGAGTPPTVAESGTGAGAGASAQAPAAGAAVAAGEVYIVKQGDTLAKIAGKFGVSVKQLRAVNKLKGDRIVAKQKLTIPAKSAAPASPSASAASGAAAPARAAASTN